MKIRFNSGDNLPIKQEIQMHNVVMIIRFVFYDKKKLSTSILDECLHKLAEQVLSWKLYMNLVNSCEFISDKLLYISDLSCYNWYERSCYSKHKLVTNLINDKL